MAQPVRVDAVVIGAGPGGYPAGIRLGQLKVKTAVVEREFIGGVCLNVGCIPSKAVIHAAKTYDKMRHSADIGIQVKGEVGIDWGKTLEWKEGVVKKLTGGVRQLLKGNGAEVIEGEATFVSPRELDVKKKDGSVVRIEAKSVVVATGSRPVQIPGFAFDGKRVIDSTGGLALAQIPKRMVVVGGGYIGLELGTVYAKLGTKVTVLEALPSLLSGMDPECVAVVARKLKKLGVEVMTNAKAKGWEEKKDRAVVTVELQGGQTATLDADVILVTVGRRPNTDGLGLEKIGVKLDPKGFILVDRQQRTNVPGVYAIGDCTPGFMLAHKATKEGEVVAEVIAGHKAEMDARTIPAVVFTDPEIASTGMTEAQAKEAGRKVKVGKFPFAALGRALSVNDPDGFAKIVADAESGEILGVHVVGGSASDLISEAALAIEMGAVLQDVGLTVHPHPTLPESLMEAAKVALGEAVHVINR
jgi:dihydrolipoamide dehydrogenase